MNILHITQPTDAGTANVVLQLVQRGAARGDNVVVASPRDEGFISRVERCGAAWRECSLRRAPSVFDIPQIPKVRRLIRQFDVVHLHSSKAGAVGRIAVSLLRRAARPRVFFTPHGWSWYVGGRLASTYKTFERYAARVSTAIVVVSQKELNDGRAVIGDAARMEVIPNGVDTRLFSPRPHSNLNVHSARDVPSGPLLVHAGRLCRQKGQDRSLRALATVVREIDAHLRVVGDGPDSNRLRVLADELGVTARVDFVGSQPMVDHLRDADIVLLPSRWEGMSLVMLEAMACGTPIVATDCGGIEAISDICPIVPQEGDEELVANALGKAILQLWDGTHLSADLGWRLRLRARDRYEESLVFQAYARLWASPAQTST